MKIDIILDNLIIEKSQVIGHKISSYGYLEFDKFDRDECWHLCNWSSWSKFKPQNLHSNIMACSSNIAFKDPESGIYHIALGIGWKEEKDFINVLEHFSSRYNRLFKNNKTTFPNL